MRRTVVGLGFAVAGAVALAAQATRAGRGVSLADLTWVDAAPLLNASAVVVIPLGAGAVEHGPHLKLNANERLARYLTSRVQEASAVVVAPLLTYHFYQAYLDYPGTASLTAGTARDLTIDAVRSLARSGPRRFYVLNTGAPTTVPLARAAERLRDEGILLGYTDMDAAVPRIPALQQRAVTTAHADEVETSMLLYVDPLAVDMTKAVREYGRGSGPMTRRPGATGFYSASGVSGDATLATREKGRALVEGLVQYVIDDIEKVRAAPLPGVQASAPAFRDAIPEVRPSVAMTDGGCTPQDDRAIRAIGPRFGAAWSQMRADLIASLFAESGDMRHPDGAIERGRDIIRENRRELFTRHEYRGSVHALSLNDIRCVAHDVALADGKWELRNVGGEQLAATRRPYTGWCTLILRRVGQQWEIEAWRYTVDPPPNTSAPPTILKRPGWPGGPGGH